MANRSWLYRDVTLLERWISELDSASFRPDVYKRVIVYLNKLKAFYEDIDKMYSERTEWDDGEEYSYGWTNEELRGVKSRFNRVEESLDKWIAWAENNYHSDLAQWLKYLREFSGSFNFDVRDKDESVDNEIVAPIDKYMDLVEGVKQTGMAAVPAIDNFIGAVDSLKSAIKKLSVENLWTESNTSTNAVDWLKYILEDFKDEIVRCQIRRQSVDELRKLISTYNSLRDYNNVHVTLESNVIDRENGYVPSAFRDLMYDLGHYGNIGRKGIGEFLVRSISYASDSLNTFEGAVSNYIDRQNSGADGGKLNRVDDFALLDEISNARNALNAVGGKIGKFASECDAAGKEGFKVVQDFWNALRK